MTDPSKQREKSIALTISDEAHDYRCVLYFNTFSIEPVENGCFIRVAFVHPGMASDIIPIFFAIEGLAQLKDTSKQYVQGFNQAALPSIPPLPPVRQAAPLFANHARLARTGGTAEIALYIVPIHTIAAAVKGKHTSSTVVRAVPVALLHSECAIHEQLILSLLGAL